MQKAILVINLGSSSLKFSVFTLTNHELDTTAQIRGEFAPLNTTTQLKLCDKNGIATEQIIKLTSEENYDTHALVIKYLLNWLKDEYPNYQFIGAGHRVVHGGNLFAHPILITTEILTKLKRFCPLAPLHQPYNLAGIKILAQQLPHLKQVACFDTAFHTTQTKVARGYALPESVAKNLIKRYGFHGLSYEYIAQVLPEYLDSTIANSKIIVAHLGHGASLCAMQERKSMATTMGFTALDGLPMGTRCGNLDPGVVLYLMAEEKMTVAEVTDLLYNQCGLLGVSKISSDIRTLISSDDPNAQYAIDLFVYRIVREIGSLTAALGGLNALIFTGGIGEHSATIREKVCQQLSWLGAHLNLTANVANETKISADKISVPVLIIPTNEELVIAQHTWSCIG